MSVHLPSTASPGSPATERGICVLVVSEWSLLRAAYRRLLASDPRIVQVEDAGVPCAFQLALARRPDVIVHDADGPDNAIDTVMQLSAAELCRGLVVVTTSKSMERRLALHRAGAKAVVLKDQSESSLLTTIHGVASGQVFLEPEMRNEFLRLVHAPPQDHDGSDMRHATLTKREQEVLRIVARGCRNRQVATELGISEITVRHHLSSIFSKLQVVDRLELVVYAREVGLA